jgi:hypothetical protein
MMFGLYAMIYNMLNYAAGIYKIYVYIEIFLKKGVVPVTIVREDE